MRDTLYLLQVKSLLDNNYMVKSERNENPTLPTKCILHKKYTELEKNMLKSNLTNLTFKKSTVNITNRLTLAIHCTGNEVFY